MSSIATDRSPATETIVAIATPPGRGGIGIVRLSGPEAFEIALRLVNLNAPLEAGRVRLGAVLAPVEGLIDVPVTGSFEDSVAMDMPRDRQREVIDQAIVTGFRTPHSYTGEDVIEIAAHGSPVVLEVLLRGALNAGARLAGPGEFTQRAFLNRRLDLTQAEAVHDLIASQTLEQARMAARQLGGALARRVAPIKERLIGLIALLEAGMDFASGELDDVEVVPPAEIGAAVEEVSAPLAALAASYAGGRRLREGATLALVGRPNVGKSSLFNRLLERERAIVTAVPGTTRDTIEETLAVGGIPVRLIDTAGLRGGEERPADEAEAMGMARSREALADADLLLLVVDCTQPLREEEQDLRCSLAGRAHLVVRNKADLLGRCREIDTESDGLLTSAYTGEGLEQLRLAILHALHAEGSMASEGVLNTLRQQQAVQEALDALGAAARANGDRLAHEALLIDLHRALEALDSLTGQTTPDDILNRIFSTFCIGK